MEDLSRWLTIPQFAEATGKSTRSIERLVAKQLIEHTKRPEEGKKPVVVIAPQEIEKQKAIILRPVLQKSDSPTNRQTDTLPVKATNRQADMESVLQVGQQLVKTLEALELGVSPKVFLSLREAALYLGYPQSEVRRLVDSGGIPSHTLSNGWRRVARTDLDQYRPTKRQADTWRNGREAGAQP
jgi:excisionase family DNA binding protein